MTETVSEQHLLNVYLELKCLVHVPSSNTEEAGLMSYTAASHQGANRVIWLRSFGGSCNVVHLYTQSVVPIFIHIPHINQHLCNYALPH